MVLDSTTRPRSIAHKVVASGLVLIVLMTAVLWWVGHQAVLGVHATTGIPSCDGTQLTTVKDPGSKFERVAIPMTEGFECTLTIRLVNDSDRQVTLTQISLPTGGPEGGASFRVTHLGDDAVPAGDQVDAVADLDRPLAPGGEELVDMRVVFRESGCTSEGGSMWVYPTIRVGDLLASHGLTIADLPVFLGTPESSCDA